MLNYPLPCMNGFGFIPRNAKPKTPNSKLFTFYLCRMNVRDDLQQRWWNLEARLVERFNKKPDMEAILFLIGVQELGDLQTSYSKEQKQDLMHVAVCHLLSASGYYELERVDEDGWPHYRQLRPMPDMNPVEQENFIKDHILLYFEQKEY